ncbi:intracellular septation protein A [Hephaestia caeni]|uniref:Inner membrane-spanning protein YciB n=1 Tax=Hephaestia caeni TaxID=645617 RepID=A0A397PEQ9_9SPHN|nr:inner membrane-spanning protein YciB [Hephaestia caeni]RIA45647.1 intracellular septation protein A [Hephaestia caeni]
MTERAEQDDSPGIRMAVDYAPLVVFFAVNFLVPAGVAMRIVAGATPFLEGVDKLGAVVIARVILATASFVLATIAALIVSKIKLGRISPMLWISGVLVLVFGGLTIYFHDPKFIQVKPTILYAMFAGILGFGLVTGRPLLEALLGSAYPGLNALGWRKLTRNWALFFVAMALLNELVWRSTSWDFWVGFKLWGALPLTFAFALANVPMLMRHGLTVAEKAVTDLPPEG